VSDTFWNKLTPDLQKTMSELWEQNIGAYRASTAKGQLDGRKTMETHGVAFVEATPEETAASRKTMMPHQDAMAKEIKVSPEMVKLVMQDLGVSS
jgi:C4-dicarboxylate-binding protein DctP